MDKIYPAPNTMFTNYNYNYPSRLTVAFKEVCPDGDAWRFGSRTIALFVYDMLFELRLHAALTGAYRRWTWAESGT